MNVVPKEQAKSRAGKSKSRPLLYLPYPKALKSLSDRLSATADEIAAWVFFGPNDSGLEAYLNANELADPPRFNYVGGYQDSDFDYLAPLAACWFRAEQVEHFQPVHRFITGDALVQRWSGVPGLVPQAYILAKVSESRLLPFHPNFGLTQASMPGRSMPPIEKGLFFLSHVEAVEREDLGGLLAHPPKTLSEIEFASRRGSAGAMARYSQPGGVYDQQNGLRDKWASGKYKSRNECAQKECESHGMSFKAARNALIGTPAPRAHGGLTEARETL